MNNWTFTTTGLIVAVFLAASYQFGNANSVHLHHVYDGQIEQGTFITEPEVAISAKGVELCINSFVRILSVTSQADSIFWDCSGCDFDEGNENSFDPIEISWDQPGVYPVSATVFNGSCTAVAYDTITVESLIEPLNITCAPAENSLVISWNMIPCVSSYEIFINGSITEAGYSDTTYTVQNLEPDEVVDISIFAGSDCHCPPSLTTINCSTFPTSVDNEIVGLSLYPNPLQSILNIETEFNTSFQFRLFNNRGEALRSGVVDQSQIILDDVPDGIYMMLLESKDGNRHMERIVKF